MSKHTPGPWVVEHETHITGSEASPEIGCVGKVDIAHVYLRAVPGKTEANARLIAAAPELLEAAIQSIPLLEEYMQLGIDTDAPDSADAFEAVLLIMKHAIAKAIGEQQ